MNFFFISLLFFFISFFSSVFGRKFLAKRGEHVLIDICVHFFISRCQFIEAGVCVIYPFFVDTLGSISMYMLVE